jgi:hypothetical protein
VDGADYTVFRDTMGSTTDMRADGNGNHVIDEGDFLMWRSHYGQTMPVGGGGSAASSASAVLPRTPRVTPIAVRTEVTAMAASSAIELDEKEQATLVAKPQPAPNLSQPVVAADRALIFEPVSSAGVVTDPASPLAPVLSTSGLRQDRLLAAWLASLEVEEPSSDDAADSFAADQTADDADSESAAVDELFELIGTG